MDYTLNLIFVLLARAIVTIRPFLPVICFVFLWSAIALAVWHLFTGLRQGVKTVKRLHQIPCADCRYATCSYHLKCSVQPVIAFSEEAIGCQDFEQSEDRYIPALTHR